MKLRALAVLLTGGLAAAHVLAQAARFPHRPVTVVVAFAPGGNNDVPVRIVAARLGDLWGVAVNTDNRPGSGGIVGTQAVARSAPDGHTLLNCNSATHGVNPVLHRKLPYDAISGFAPVAMIGSAPNVLVVPASSPIRSARDFLALAKNDPSGVAIATAGIGSTQHFALELIRAMTGADITHIPDKGGAPALADVIAGQVPMAITGMPTALPAIRTGRVRALAVTSAQRSKQAPEVPTLSEAGLSGFEVTTWTGLCAPAGTPETIVRQASEDIRRAVESAEVRQQLLNAGVEPNHVPAARFGELIASEIARFGRIAEKAGIAAE